MKQSKRKEKSVVKARKSNDYFRYVLNLFKRNRVYTRKEIEEKLKRRGASVEEYEDVVKRLEEKGFVDDRRYSEMYIYDALTLKKWGRWKIRQRLREKGVDENVIEEAMAKVTGEVDVEGIIIDLVNKRIGDGKTSKQEIRSVKKFLVNRGFDIEEIDDAIGKMREM